MSLPTQNKMSLSDLNQAARFTNGNLGIGTTSPGSKLDVNGTIRAISQVAPSSGTGCELTWDGSTSNVRSYNRSANTFQPLILSANQISLVSGTTASTSVFVNTAGNVGIGTTSPIGKLHVSGGSGTNGCVLISGSDAYGHSLYVASTDTSKRIAFNHTGAVGNIFAYDYTTGVQNLTLQAPGGNVGIATTNPAYRLDTNGTIRIAPRGYGDSSSGVANGLIIYNGQYNGSGDGSSIVFDHSYGSLAQDRLSSITSICPSGTYGLVTDLYFKTSFSGASTERMRITGAGNVGIGTTSPVSRLNVNGDISLDNHGNRIGFVVNDTFQFMSKTMGNYALSWDITTNTNGAAAHFSGWGGIHLFTQTTPRMTINPAGNVGIGTTSPVSRLHLANSSTAANIVFEAGSTADGGAANSGWAAINFNGYFSGTEQRINTSKNRWRLICEQRSTADAMYLETFNGSATTNILTFTTAGNIGTGLTNPSYKLHIVDPSSSPFSIWVDGTGKTTNTGINVNAASGYCAFINLQANGSGPNIAGYSNRLEITQSASQNTFINPNGGSVGIGTTDPYATLHVSGQAYITNAQVGQPGLSTMGGAGTKIVLWPGGGDSIPYGIGVETSHVWFSSNGGFKWYNTALGAIMHLTGGNLLTTGDVIAFSSISDARLKTDVENISDESSFDIVNSLRPVSFTWLDTIANQSCRGKRDIGFIAQEVESSTHYAVGEFNEINSQDTYKRIKYERLVPYLVGSIKHLTTKLEEYKAELDDLRSKLN